MNEDKDPFEGWHQYRRHPILIHPSCCILVTVFRGHGHIQDIWSYDIPPERSREDEYEIAAEQFIKQLEGHDCIAFHEALAKACQKRVDEWRSGSRGLNNE